MSEITSSYNNFVSGEISADVFGRYDTPVYRKGAEILRNFMVKVQGPISYRPGFSYIANTKDNKKAVLHRFIVSDELAYALEFTDKTIRFYLNNGLIMDPNNPMFPLELESPYSEKDDLALINVAQNADTMYLVHPLYQPRKLQRFGSTDWRLSLVEASGGRAQIPRLYTWVGSNVTIAGKASSGSLSYLEDHAPFYGWGKGDEGFKFNGNANTIITSCEFEEYLLSGSYTFSVHLHKEITNIQIKVITVNSEGTESSSTNEIVTTNWPESNLDADCLLITTGISTTASIKSIELSFNASDANKVYSMYQAQLSDTPLFPFTSEGNYPRAVAFAQSRLWYGGTDNAVDKIWGSCGPDTDGTTHYDNFLTGVNATDAVTYILAPVADRVEAIKWISSNNKFLLVGTSGGVSKVTGGSDDSAITPTSVNVRRITAYGVSFAPAESIGSMVYYIQRTMQRLREIKYYLADDAYIAEDKNLTSTDIIYEGLTKIQYVVGTSDVLYGVRTDGVLVGLTVEKTEGIAAWHRHYLGGDFRVESIVSLPRAEKTDQLMVSGRLEVNGETVRFVLSLSDEVRMPVQIDFYTGPNNEKADKERWYNAIYQKQIDYNYLDCSLTYDGSEYATQDLTIEDNLADESIAIITAKESLFSSSWEGHQIWGAYDDEGFGGGRYEIVSVDSETQITVKILSRSDFNVLKKGKWYLTAQTLAGLDYLEGKTVSVFASGQTHADVKVTDGRIDLDSHYHKITVGLGYTGIYKSPDIELSRATVMPQSSLALARRMLWIDVKFMDTLGASLGSSIYRTERILNADTTQRLGMPPRPFTGIKEVKLQSGYNNGGVDDTESHVIVLQDLPQPCNILVIQPRLDVGDE